MCKLAGMAAMASALQPAAAQSAELVTPTITTVVRSGDGVTADFDNDGYDDVVLGSTTTAQMSVHRNLSGIVGSDPGEFAAGVSLVTSFTGPSAVAVGSVDGDAFVDVVGVESDGFCSGTFGTSVQLFLNNGQPFPAISFTASPAQALGFRATAAAMGDVNPAPGEELVIADDCSGMLRIYQYTPALQSSFTEIQTIAVGPDPTTVQCVDMDGDDDVDIAVGHENQASIVYNTAPGGLIAVPVAGVAAQDLDVADVDGDGLLDLVTADGSYGGGFTLVRQLPGATFTSTSIALPTGLFASAERVEFGDFDSNGRPDVLVARHFTGASVDIRLYINSGGAPFYDTQVQVAPEAFGAAGLIAVDSDGDGDSDFVRVISNGNGVPSTFESWWNTTPSAASPYPGTGGDLTLLTGVYSSAGQPIDGVDSKPLKDASPGDVLSMQMLSPGLSLAFSPSILALQLVAPPLPGPSETPGYPGLYFDLVNPQAIVILHNDLAAPFGAGVLSIEGVSLAVVLPALPPGSRLLIQGGAADLAAGELVFTDGHLVTL